MTSSPTLDFDQTLAALLGLIGQKVEIKLDVIVRGESGITAGFMSGVLRRAVNRGLAVMPDLDAGVDEWNNHDAHFFEVGSEPGTGFYVAPQSFRSARWLSPTQHDLWIEQSPHLVIAIIAPSRVS